MAKGDAAVIDRAQRRALIAGFLANHEGDHAVKDIAEQTGLRGNVVGLTLKEMAEAGQAYHTRTERGSKYYQDGEADVPTTKEKRTRRGKLGTAKDIELVFSGTMIVIGRNSETGRLRITLEDIAG